MHRDSGFAGRLQVVSTGRRRRWSVEEKIRIIEESFAGHRQASATARRHDIPVPLLFKWRREYRQGELGGGAGASTRFVPAVVTPEEPAAVASPASPGLRYGACGGRMEIALAGGHRVAVGADVDAAALRVVVEVLEGPPLPRLRRAGEP
jgi:transposase